MPGKPEPPPDAVLISLARNTAGLSIIEAAALVRTTYKRGVSKARWSQIEAGYEMRGGQPRPVRANPAMLAHMAWHLGVTPARLEAADNGDGRAREAAGILTEIIATRPAPPDRGAAADTLAVTREPPPGTPGGPGFRDPARNDADRPYAAEITARYLDLARQGITDPDGAQMFPGPAGELDAATWDQAREWPPAWRVWILADLHRTDAGRDNNGSKEQAG